MKKREEIINECFQAWVSKDVQRFMNCFAPCACYIESWGPAYRTLREIVRWFNDWNERNTVLQLDIGRFWHEGQTVKAAARCTGDRISLCEWYFSCHENGVLNSFDGLSIIQFNEHNKIVYIKEFLCKFPNHYPYEGQ